MDELGLYSAGIPERRFAMLFMITYASGD